MAEIVTPAEMAKTLGISPKTLRAWMRRGRDAGHPLLASHLHNQNWEFTRPDADQLIAEYRGRRTAAAAPRATVGPAPAVQAARPTVLRASRASSARTATPRSSDVPPLPPAFTRKALTEIGFDGWKTWPQLRAAAYEGIPSLPGVYVIYRPGTDLPQFIDPGTGGFFKGRDPNVRQARLEAEWVPGARVLNIGKADARKAGGRSDALHRRLSEYGKFGAGQDIGHSGGRLIWQLANADKLLVAWHVISWDETARGYEQRLLARFAELYDGRRPFTNLTG